MKRRKFMTGVVGGLGLTLLAGGPARASFTETDAAAGVRLALERGASAAVALLGRTDGFLGNPKVRIPLPGVLNDAAGLLRATGQQRRVDELMVAMNRAAEMAVAESKPLLVNAVKSMSVEDARDIVGGGDDSVTRFFVAKTRAPLTERFLPVVTRATQRVSLAAKYNALADRAARMGLLNPQDARIEQHVTNKALDGLFLMIGEEERKIRQDPVGTGSALLKRVFGG